MLSNSCAVSNVSRLTAAPSLPSWGLEDEGIQEDSSKVTAVSVVSVDALGSPPSRMAKFLNACPVEGLLASGSSESDSGSSSSPVISIPGMAEAIIGVSVPVSFVSAQ